MASSGRSPRLATYSWVRKMTKIMNTVQLRTAVLNVAESGTQPCDRCWQVSPILMFEEAIVRLDQLMSVRRVTVGGENLKANSAIKAHVGMLHH